MPMACSRLPVAPLYLLIWRNDKLSPLTAVMVVSMA